MTEQTASPNTATVAILVPKTHSGFFSAVSLKSYLQTLGISEVQVIEARPCQLKLAKIPDNVTDLYVAGLGIKNCPLSGMENFFVANQSKIKLWVDSHPEGKPLEMLKGNNIYLHASSKKAPSCPAILQRKFGEVIRPEWIAAANHLENGFAHPSSDLAHRFENLTKLANGRLEEAKELFAQNLLTGTPSLNEIETYLGS